MKGGGSYSGNYHRSQLASAEQMEVHLPNPNQHMMINDVVLPASYNIQGLVEKKITTTSYSPPSKSHKKKKQVRRRLHTTKPYQERLLNMAEARKEIVTALKFHRASMKNNNHHQQPPPPSPLPAQSSSSSLGLNLSFHEFTHLDFATLYRSDVTPALEFSPSSPHESDAADSAGCSVPDQVGTAPPCQFDDEMEWNCSFLLQEDQFEQEFPLFSNSADPSTATNLGLPCMKLEEFDGLDDEWLSWH